MGACNLLLQILCLYLLFFFFSSRRRHTRWNCDWSSDVCSSDLDLKKALGRWPHDPEFFATREIGTDEVLPWDYLDHGLTKKYLARELKRGVGALITPKCRLGTCRACGLACADHPELVEPLPAELAARGENDEGAGMGARPCAERFTSAQIRA